MTKPRPPRSWKHERKSFHHRHRDGIGEYEAVDRAEKAIFSGHTGDQLGGSMELGPPIGFETVVWMFEVIV